MINRVSIPVMTASFTEFAVTGRGRYGQRNTESAPNSAVRSDRRFTEWPEYADLIQ
jgi:hypothetical protein